MMHLGSLILPALHDLPAASKATAAWCSMAGVKAKEVRRKPRRRVLELGLIRFGEHSVACVLRNFSQIGACEINLLRAEGKCIAGQFCLVTGDTSYILKIGYDEAYAQVAPGNMLLEQAIQRHLSEGAIKYVNLVTDTPWHSSWRPLSYAVSRIWVFNITAAGLTAYSLLRAKGPLSHTYRHWLKPLLITTGWGSRPLCRTE